MPKDIRSYFGNVKSSSHKKSNEYEDQKATSKKRARRIIDSDEEEDSVFTSSISTKKKCKETNNASSSKSPKKNEVIVNVETVFGNTPVIQKKNTVIPSKKSYIEASPSKGKNKKGSKSKKETDSKKVSSPSFEYDHELDETLLQTDDEQLESRALSSAKKEHKNFSKNKKVDVQTSKISKMKSPKKEVSRQTPIKTPIKNDDVVVESKSAPDSSSKKKNAEAYQKYLNRSGPKNPGSKKIPEGTPECLLGMTFVVTGILDSMEREEAVELIQKCGGRVTSQVSKKTSFLVVGEEPGESKISKAKKFNIPEMTEDELLKLIVDKSKSKKKDDVIQNTPEKSSKYFDMSKKQKFTKFCDSSLQDNGAPLCKIPKIEESKNFDKISKTPIIPDTASTLIKQTAAKISENFEVIDKNIIKETIKIVQDSDSMLWVEKYKPKSTKTIVGQGGDKSNVKKLLYWLKNWHKNHSNKNGKKLFKPAPWSQNDDGRFYKAALLSGPPGVGKTTSIHLVCQELGFDIIEFNASDTRSKKLLHEDVSELLSSKSLRGFAHDNKNSFSKQVLLMDEVDGMAGNEDRGGMQELIQLIKNTKIPIIGICNDRNHPKIRSLVNHCFDLRFQRPPVKQIKAAMMSVCFKENINITGEALEELIISSNHDLRQVLHRLSLLSSSNKSLSLEEAKKNGVDAKKPLNLGPWDVVRKVFTASEQEKLTLNEKIELFFQDYSIGPLFVQDIYLHVKSHQSKNNETQTLELISKTADSIALGDIVERAIRNQNSWSLLPVQSVLSTVLPGNYMSGHIQGRIDFPVWLGKNSKARKFTRMLLALHTSLGPSITGDGLAVNLDYLQTLKNSIIRPLVEKGSEGIQESVKFMVGYNLIREDLDSILELSSWPNVTDQFSTIDSKVKAAFTRALNKECHSVSHVCKRPNKIVDDEFESNMEDEEDNNEDNENIDSDPMIKKGKSKKVASGESKSTKKTTKKDNSKKANK